IVGFARFDNDVVDTQLVDHGEHFFFHAGRNGEHGHHRADTEDHAKHGQQAAQLVYQEARKPHVKFRQVPRKHFDYFPLPAGAAPAEGMPTPGLDEPEDFSFLSFFLAVGSPSAMVSPGFRPSAITMTD